jgi:hypothetical protein
MFLIQTKIEHYESLDKSTLNTDQLETLNRKQECNTSIKDLEEILKQLSIDEAEVQQN